MTDPIAFVLASLALLAAPGPTNTLLATSGAAAGLKRSQWLIPVAALGYAMSVVFIGLVVAPLLKASAWIDAGLRLICAAYLGYAAWKLWREGSDGSLSGEPVSPSRMFTATLLNPKGIVLALVLVPWLKDGRVAAALPYLAGLICIVLAVSFGWMGAGALARRTAGGRVESGAVRKTGAVVLALFGGLMAASVLSVE